MKTQRVFVALILCFLISQITCTIENFEFEYDDIRNDIDGLSNDYVERMNFPSMDAGGYHKYPLRPKTILATVDSTQRHQPTVCTSNAVKPNNNQNTALAEVAVVQPAHRAIPDDQKPAPTRQIPYTISAAQLTVPDPMQTKQKAPIVGATVKPQGNFVYHQRAIILNPSSVPNSQPYYSQMTPQNYMVRPIYVRMMKPFQGNYLVNQMAVNQQSQLAQSRRATLQ